MNQLDAARKARNVILYGTRSSRQKYHRGDICRYLGRTPYGNVNCLVVIMGSYRDEYGGVLYGNDPHHSKTFTVYDVKAKAEWAWADESKLKLLEKAR